MIVEFFGVPGGGKTQILRQLVAAIPGAREARAASRGAVARGVVSFALRHPLSFLVWMSELCLHANGLFRYKLGLLFRAMAARAGAERADRSQIAFVDEGLLQRLLTIFDSPLSSRRIAFLLRMPPLPNVVVVVRGGEFWRFTIAHNRSNSPRVKGGEVRLQEWMRNVRATAALVESELPYYTDVVVCTRGEMDADPAVLRRDIEQYRDKVCGIL